MKILITVATYYPKNDGVSMVTQYLAEGLASRGNEVKVITSLRGIDKESDVRNGVKIKRVNLRTKFGLYFGNKKEYRRMIEKETDWADVMINVCTQNAFTDVILKNIGKYNCKKILYMHGMFDFKFRMVYFSSLAGMMNKIWKEVRWFFYYKLNKWFFRQYDSVIQLHEKDYGNVYFKKKFGIKSIIIENAADEEFFTHEVSKGFEKPFDKYLLFVANYNDRKNQKLAVSSFLNSNIDSKIGLVLIGSKRSTYYDYLERYIKKQRKKKSLSEEEKPILLLTDVDRKDIPSYVFNAYLSLMTSKWEAFPISVVESIASGVPFISTNVGIVRYFLGGVVSTKGDISYWIEKLVHDSVMRSELAKLCRFFGQENFRMEEKVDLLEKEIKRLTQNNNIKEKV